MKKLFYLLVLAAAVGITAGCDNEPKNPGDFTVKSELTLGDVVSLVNGEVYPIHIVRETDTVYQHEYTRTDTVTGVIDTLYYGSQFTARFYEAAPIWLGAQADTFRIQVRTNARWNAPTPTPTTGAQWYYIESGNQGGGDSEIVFRVARNRNASRVSTSYLEVFTNDSTVMYRVPFRQYGERDSQ